MTMQCKDINLSKLRYKYIESVTKSISSFMCLPSQSQFDYMLCAHDTTILSLTGQFLYNVISYTDKIVK